MDGFFFPAPEAIVRDLGPAPAVLYGRIWRFCQAGGTCYARIATLAEDCGTSERTVKRWIADLEEGGWIYVDRRFGLTNSLRTTGKWVMGGPGQNDPGNLGQNGLGGRPKRPGYPGQNGPQRKELQDMTKRKSSVSPYGVAAAVSPAATSPSAAQDGGSVDEALTVACIQAITDREGDDLASYDSRTVREARTAARSIVQAWPDVSPEDIQAAAAAWVERLARIRKGGHVDPPRGSQLVEALGSWTPLKTAARRQTMTLIPAVER